MSDNFIDLSTSNLMETNGGRRVFVFSFLGRLGYDVLNNISKKTTGKTIGDHLTSGQKLGGLGIDH